MTTRKWSCMCGNFEGQVEGDAKLAVWCHCKQCRQATGSAMQLGVWDDLKILKGEGDLIAYKKDPSAETTRHACSKCGSFCYKILPGGVKVAPLGALEGGPVVKPTCHIFAAHKGDQEIMFPDLPQHDEMP